MMKRHKSDTRHSTPPHATRKQHSSGKTSRAETPVLEGRVPLPEEITGRASGTGESLVSLFDDGTAQHLTDGFQGGSEEIPAE